MEKKASGVVYMIVILGMLPDTERTLQAWVILPAFRVSFIGYIWAVKSEHLLRHDGCTLVMVLRTSSPEGDNSNRFDNRF